MDVAEFLDQRISDKITLCKADGTKIENIPVSNVTPTSTGVVEIITAKDNKDGKKFCIEQSDKIIYNGQEFQAVLSIHKISDGNIREGYFKVQAKTSDNISGSSSIINNINMEANKGIISTGSAENNIANSAQSMGKNNEDSSKSYNLQDVPTSELVLELLRRIFLFWRKRKRTE